MPPDPEPETEPPSGSMPPPEAVREGALRAEREAGGASRHASAKDVGTSPFTPREAEVLQAISEGLSCRDIARELRMSESTARKHRSNMLAKVARRNAAELVSLARTNGWLKPAHGPPRGSPLPA